MGTEITTRYMNYIDTHIKNVKRAYAEKIRPLILKLDYVDDIEMIDRMVGKHDESKYLPSEFIAYRDYFYGDPEDKDEDKFGVAWLHHQHRNPHHWQYWILRKDDGTFVAHDMDLIYIIEMIADWSSFQYSGKGNANEWYEKNKDKMFLSDYTRKAIEDILSLDRSI